MQNFPENTIANSPARYLFKLTSEIANQTIICNPEPLEWSSGMFEMNRDLSMGGVFSSFQLDSLTFLGNGAKLLADLYEAYELNAECTLIVYWFKESIRDYVEFPTRFNINFNFYESGKIGGFHFGVKVKAIDSSVQTKLENRKDINVNLSKLKTIGQNTISDFQGLKKNLNYDETNIFNYADLQSDFLTEYDLPRKPVGDCYASIPLNIVSNDFGDRINTILFRNRVKNLKEIVPFYYYAEFDAELELSCYAQFYVYEQHSGTPPWTVQIIQSDLSCTVNDETELLTFGNDKGLVIMNETTTISLLKGNSLRFVVKTGDIADIKATMSNGYISITQKIITSPAKTTEGFPLYEALERVSQHVLDTQYPIYSDFFGRQDTPYKTGVSGYAAQNQLRYAHIQTGLNLRGVGISDLNNPIAVNFKDIFKTVQCAYNVGYTLETNPILYGDNLTRIRIEQYAYFFQNTEVLDLSSRINRYDIQSSVMPELCPVSLKSGFENYEYLQINGRGEPNTTNQRTSIINTDSKFENIVQLRGDTKGILDALGTPIDTTDTKVDNSLFIVKTQRSGLEWIPERGENIAIEGNTSIFGNDLYNRYFTPTRMLKRHGNKISAGFTKPIFQESSLVFQTSEKLQTLRTIGTAQSEEVYTISENEDILVSDLANPIYKPMKHTIECDFSFADLEAIQANPFGYLRYTTPESTNLTGFLINLKKKNDEGKVILTIIERIEYLA